MQGEPGFPGYDGLPGVVGYPGNEGHQGSAGDKVVACLEQICVETSVFLRVP